MTGQPAPAADPGKEIADRGGGKNQIP